MTPSRHSNPDSLAPNARQPDFWADTVTQPPVPADSGNPAVFADEAGRIAERLLALTHSKFRMSWHLKAQQVRYIHEKGISTIARHAEELIATRLAPAVIPNDGSQTPMKGHPVFIAQHATGTCCRNCLKKWHHIEPGTTFTPAQQHYVTTLIMTGIHQQLSRWQVPPAQPPAISWKNTVKKRRGRKTSLESSNPTDDLFD